jgi:hypothetical protein
LATVAKGCGELPPPPLDGVLRFDRYETARFDRARRTFR